MILESTSTPATAAIPRSRDSSHFGSEVRALVWRRLIHMRAAPGRLIGIVLNPLVILIAVGYLFAGAVSVPGDGGQYVNYLFGGVVLQVGLAMVGPTATAVNLDLRRGLMDRFRSMPIARIGVLIAHSIADLLVGIVTIAFVSGVAFAIGWRPTTSATETLLGFGAVIAFVYASIWAGIALGMLVKQPESIISISSLALVVLSFLSNAILSPSAMPGWLRPVAEWNPVSVVADLVRGLWGNPTSGSSAIVADNAVVISIATFGVVVIAAVLYSQRKFRRGF